MSKLYKFVAEQWVEANNEEEAIDEFAYGSWDLAVNARCYEACPRCRGILGGAKDGCTCDRAPSSRTRR